MSENEFENKKLNLIKINIEYYFIFIITILLLVVGMVMVSSASMSLGSSYRNDAFYFIRRQSIWSAISIIVLFALNKIDYHKIARVSNFLIWITIGLLLLVFIPKIGVESGGARRWFVFGFSVQPSEIAKIVVIIYLADLFNRRYRNLHKLKSLLLPALIYLGGISFLILKEPDYSTVIIIWIIVIIIMFVGEVRIKHLIGIIMTLGITALGSLFLQSYRRARILEFFSRSAEGSSNIYQVRQSIIALGSGNIFGVGLGNSMQKYSYLPEANTDFIFSIIGEEFGLIGTLFVVLLFVLFAFFGIRVAIKARDYLGRVIAAGITSLIVLQAAINISVSVNILPVTGVTLPFISFGGSSLVMTMAGAGILLNISKYKIISAAGENE